MKIFPILKRLSAKNVKLGAIPFATALTAIIGLGACNMVNEDMDPCAPPPRIRAVVDFEYTYNMTEQDWFTSHAGSVYLYVFDDDDTFLFRRSRTKTIMEPNNIDFSIVLDENEIQLGHKYKFVAVALGNHAGYQASLETPGFQIPEENIMVPGVSKLDDYRLKLDRDGDGIYDFGVTTDDYGVFNFKDAYNDNRLKLDTLWSTKPNSVQVLDVPYVEFKPQVEPYDDIEMNVLVPMMRITNSIKVNLLNSTFTAETDPKLFNVVIDFPNGNGTIGFTGTTYPIQELMYLTLRKSMKQYQEKGTGAKYDSEPVDDQPSQGGNQSADPEEMGANGFLTRADDSPTYALNAEFGVSRLQCNDGSFLEVSNAETGIVVCRINNLSDWLADYFSDSHYYGDQEYLDREYDFTIDIKLNDTGDGIEWWQIGCSILGWGKRVQYLDF